MSALGPVQQAVFTRLDTFAPLAARAKVYDHVPEGTALPYVVIGEATETARATFDRRGYTDTVTLHIWSGRPGYKEAYEVAALVADALEGVTLLPAGYSPMAMALEAANSLRDDDLRHVVVTYRCALMKGA